MPVPARGDVARRGAGVNGGSADDPDVRRLRWRSRRGLRELDMILRRYLDERYAAAAPAQRVAFARLLEQPDADILAWLLGRARPPADLADVVAAIAADA